MNEYLDEKKSVKIDLNTILSVLTHLKEIELMNEQENDSDEYLDAFVALGGLPSKEGFISKNTLIGIIKTEFELTIDMEVSYALQPQHILIKLPLGILKENWR